MSKAPIKYNKLIKRLKKEYGIEELEKRGKGSERMLIKPIEPGGKQGPTYPLKCHGEGMDVPIPVILAILRRFDIDTNDFFK